MPHELGLLLTARADLDAAEAARHYQAITAQADRYGFSCIMASHHYRSTPPYLHAVTLLARLAADTHLTLATGVVPLPLIHPIELAEAVATLDILSEGRAVLGVGTGYRAEEFEAFGVAHGTRVRLLSTGVNAIREIWAQQWADTGTPIGGARPLRRSGVPIWVAGMQDNGVRRAAALGDAWLPPSSASLATLERQCGIYRRTLHTLQRPQPAFLPVRRDLLIGRTTSQAWDDAGRSVGPWLAQFVGWGALSEMPDADRAVHLQSASSERTRKLVGDRVIVGDAETCRNTLLAVGEACECDLLIVLHLDWPGLDRVRVLDEIEILGTEVLPALHEAPPSPEAASGLAARVDIEGGASWA